MNVIINQWAREDIDIQKMLNEICPLANKIGCVGVDEIKAININDTNRIRLFEIFHDEFQENWIKQDIENTYLLMEFREDKYDRLLYFINNRDEYDLLLIYKAIKNNLKDVHQDNFIVISLDPFLIINMYGSVLGVTKAGKCQRIVTVSEGDDGWSDVTP